MQWDFNVNEATAFTVLFFFFFLNESCICWAGHSSAARSFSQSCYSLVRPPINGSIVITNPNVARFLENCRMTLFELPENSCRRVRLKWPSGVKPEQLCNPAQPHDQQVQKRKARCLSLQINLKDFGKPSLVSWGRKMSGEGRMPWYGLSFSRNDSQDGTTCWVRSPCVLGLAPSMLAQAWEAVTRLQAGCVCSLCPFFPRPFLPAIPFPVCFLPNLLPFHSYSNQPTPHPSCFLRPFVGLGKPRCSIMG